MAKGIRFFFVFMCVSNNFRVRAQAARMGTEVQMVVVLIVQGRITPQQTKLMNLPKHRSSAPLFRQSEQSQLAQLQDLQSR